MPTVLRSIGSNKSLLRKRFHHSIPRLLKRDSDSEVLLTCNVPIRGDTTRVIPTFHMDLDLNVYDDLSFVQQNIHSTVANNAIVLLGSSNV
jgi:hypothetical protein